MTAKEVYEIVHNYPSQYEKGFLPEEVHAMLAEYFPSITLEDYYETLGVHTVLYVTEEDYITYPRDIYYAITATLYNNNN